MYIHSRRNSFPFRETPLCEEINEFIGNNNVAWDVGVLICREDIRKSDPSSGVDEEDIFIAQGHPGIDDPLILANIISTDGAVSVWPTPRSENEDWLPGVQNTEFRNEVGVHLDEFVVGNSLRSIVCSDVDHDVSVLRLFTRKVPRSSEVVVSGKEVTGVLSPEKFERDSVYIAE